MNLLLVASELPPYVRRSNTGGSVAALAKALSLIGEEPRVILPLSASYANEGLLVARRVSPLVSEEQEIDVYDVALPSGVRVHLVDCGEEPSSTGSLSAKACGTFARAVVALIEEEPAEVVQAYGPIAGLSLAALQNADNSAVRALVIEDIEGVEFDRDAAKELGIQAEALHQDCFLSGQKIELLKGAVAAADEVIVPSVEVANAWVSPEHGGAFARLLSEKETIGILGGVDSSVYNPASDASLAARYDAAQPGAKVENRETMLATLTPPLDDLVGPEREPALVFVEPGQDTDANDALLLALAQLNGSGLQFIISGGEFDDDQRDALAELKTSCRLLKLRSDRERRRWLAAADFYLSIERNEVSAGRLQEAARYGALPLALARLAAKDAIVDCDAELQTGTGFLYDSLSVPSLVDVLARALAARSHQGFVALIQRTMRQDLGWDRPARRYLGLWRRLANRSAD
ncbi:MAG: glycogen/starch synthase [Polyangiaceae bacterium]|nr:glycogen/starch synthase [Polyangiaceae bacterium]